MCILSPKFRIAITGASSTGKTTLANGLLAAYPKLTAINVNARELLVEQGCKNTGNMSADQHKYFQDTYINQKRILERDKSNYLTERSFVDVFSYWSHHCEAHSTPAENKRVLNLCKKWAGRYDLHIYLPWGQIPFIEDGYRHPSPKYHYDIDLAISTTLQKWDLKTYKCRSPDLKDRLVACINAIETCEN